MNNTEQHNQANREPPALKKSLFEAVKDFFRNVNPAQADAAEEYLNKTPEKIDPARPIETQQKLRQQTQKTRLDDLKQTIEIANVSFQGNATELVVEQAREVAAEVANKTNIMGFQIEFYKKMAALSVDDQYALPYARYIAQSLETVSLADTLSSAKQKAQLALEIFVAETGETNAAIPTLKKIISSILNSHHESDVNDYFKGAEFKGLCQNYGLSQEQVDNLVVKSIEKEESLAIDVEPEMNLEAVKNNLLNAYDNIKDRVTLDLELLSMSSEKVLILLRTIDQDKAEGHNIFQDKERLNVLNESDQKNRLLKDSVVNKWIDDYIAKYGLSGTKAENLKTQVMDYYLRFRNRVYLEKMRNYSKSREVYGYPRDPYMRWVDLLNDNIIAADLMLSSYDSFLYSEYFKGQTAAAIVKENQIEQAVKAAKAEDRFAISDHMIYGDIMRDLKQGYLAEMSLEGDPNYVNMKQRISGAIAKMKMEPEIKEPVTFGSVYTRKRTASGRKSKPEISKKGMDIIFVYSRFFEDVAEGGEFTEEGYLADDTLAHMTAVYPKAMDELKQAYQTLAEIVKIAESKGDAEGLSEAAGKVTSALVDSVVEEAPIALVAMQSYLRLIRQKLAANGGIITPDMFGSTSYVKGEFSKLLEMDVKNPHQITDFEKDVYLKMGMGLAFASGEMQATLANARPPMSLSINELPKEIADKIKDGKPLTIKEMKALEGNFGPNFRDFNFRGLLMNINPLLWLHTWIKFNDYGVFNLSYTPYKTGESAIDAVTNYDLSQQIMFSTFLGLSEEAVEYFDGTYKIPALELARMNQKMSIEKRGGVREKVKQLLKTDFEVTQELGKLQQVDGNKSFEKLMQVSPLLAYSLLTDKDIADHVRVHWQVNGESVETSKLSTEFKEKKIKELLDYMHLYYPTFFTSIEQPMFFRRKELSFSQKIKERILAEMRESNNNTGYWLLLNQREINQTVTHSADIHPLGDKYMHENIIGTKRVNERMTLMMMQLQTYLQEKGDRSLSERKNLRDFVQATNPAEYDQGLSKSLDKAVDGIINLYNLQPKNKTEIRQMFIKYAKDIYYGEKGESQENNKSLFARGKYLGNTKLNSAEAAKIKKTGKGMSIPDDVINKYGSNLKDYYARLINSGIIIEPFDWAYFDKTQLNYQATGLKMTGRQIGDYSHGYMAYSAKYMDAVTALQDAISQPKESKKILQAAIDKFEGSINAISTAYSGEAAGEAGWLANAFINYPFIPSRLKDIPIAGKLPVLHSWATLFNHDDRLHLNAFDAKARKEMLDHVLKKPWSKAFLHHLQDNKKMTGLKKSLDIGQGKDGKPLLSIPLPKFLQGLVGRQFDEVYKKGKDDFSIKSMKSFLKVEDWWVGGKENFGLGYNTLMTIFVIGFLLMMFQAIKEGMKEVEIK